MPEKAHVKVTIDSGTARGEDTERNAWLKLSEEALTTITAQDTSEKEMSDVLPASIEA